MNFKPGDWVRHRHNSAIIGQVKSVDDKEDTFECNWSWVSSNDDFILWQPQEGEYFWFKSIQSFPVLAQFTGETFNSQLKFKTHCGNIWLTLDEVEPFIGILPSFIKEQQC